MMTKAAIQDALNRFKGKPAKIVGTDSAIAIYVGLEGRWAFFTDAGVAEVRSNVLNSPHYGTSGMSITESPLSYVFIAFEDVEAVEVYCQDADMAEALSGLTPIDEEKSLDDCIKEIQSASINKALSPRGNLNSAPTGFDSSYGEFKGSAISTDKAGFPDYMLKDVKKD